MTSFSSSVDASTLKEFQAIVESFLPQHDLVRFSKLSLHVMYRDPKYRDKQLRQKLFSALQDAGVMWIGQDPENQVGEAVAGRGRAPPETSNKQKQYNDPAVVAASPSSTPASKTKIRNFILSRLPQSEAHDGTKFIPFVNFVFKADKTNSFSTIEELVQYTDLLALEGVIWKKKDPLTQELKIGVVFDKKKTSTKPQQNNNNTFKNNAAASSSSPSSSTPVSFEEATSAFWEEIRRFLPDDNIGIQESVFVERLLRHTPYSFLREKEVRSSCLDFFLSKKQNMIERYFVARTTTYLRLTSKGRIAVAEPGQFFDNNKNKNNDHNNNNEDDDHGTLPDEVLDRFMHLVKLIVPADDEGASQSDVGTFIVEHCESDDDKCEMLKIKNIRQQCFKRCFEMGFLEQYAPDKMKHNLTWVRFTAEMRHIVDVSDMSLVATKAWMVARALLVLPSSTTAAVRDDGGTDHGCHVATLLDRLMPSIEALETREQLSQLVSLLSLFGFISKRNDGFLSLGEYGRRLEDWAWHAGLLSRGPTGPPFLKTTTAESLYKVKFLTEFIKCEESLGVMAALNREELFKTPDPHFETHVVEIFRLMVEFGDKTVSFERLLPRRDLGERNYWRHPAYEKEAPSSTAARAKPFFDYYREIRTRRTSKRELQRGHHSSLSGDRAKVLDSISNGMHSALGSHPPIATSLATDSSVFLIGFAVENATSPAAEKNLPTLSLELSHALLLAKRYAHPASILGDTLKSSITLRKSQKYYYRLGVYCLIYDDMIPCLTREEFDEVTYTSKYDGCDAVAVCYDENGSFCREFKNKAYIYFNVKDPKKQMLKIATIDVEATDS